jgi:hypothetical protein
MRRTGTAAIFSALLAFALAACGGSGGSTNGVAAKSPDAIASAASTAVANVNSVHVSGAINSGGSQTTLDLHLVNGKGGEGSMSQDGLGFRIVALDQLIYINGGSSFWRQFGGSAAAQLLSGKWLKAPATGQFAPLETLVNVRTLFGQLLSNHGRLAKGKTTTVRGQKVIAVNDTTNGGTLYVATTGNPYPVEIVKGGSQGGRVDFDHYNERVTLSAPANAIDVTKLR